MSVLKYLHVSLHLVERAPATPAFGLARDDDDDDAKRGRCAEWMTGIRFSGGYVTGFSRRRSLSLYDISKLRNAAGQPFS